MIMNYYEWRVSIHGSNMGSPAVLTERLGALFAVSRLVVCVDNYLPL